MNDSGAEHNGARAALHCSPAWVGVPRGEAEDPAVSGLLRIDLHHVSGFRQIGLKLQHF